MSEAVRKPRLEAGRHVRRAVHGLRRMRQEMYGIDLFACKLYFVARNCAARTIVRSWSAPVSDPRCDLPSQCVSQLARLLSGNISRRKPLWSKSLQSICSNQTQRNESSKGPVSRRCHRVLIPAFARVDESIALYHPRLPCLETHTGERACQYGLAVT